MRTINRSMRLFAFPLFAFPLFAFLFVAASLLPSDNLSAQPREQPRERVVTWVNALPDALPDGTGLKHYVLNSRKMGHNVGYVVWTPADFDARGETRYPVIYFLHGAGGTEISDARGFSSMVASAIKQGVIPPSICVFPNGGLSGYREPVESMIVEELIPLIDRTFPTNPSPASRVVAGFSMGGAGAVRLSVLHPDLFCGAGSWGGALSFRGNPAESPLLPTAKSNAPTLRKHGFSALLINGDQDRPEAFQPLAKVLKPLGIPHKIVTLEDTNHNLGKYHTKSGAQMLKFLGSRLKANHDGHSTTSLQRQPFFLAIGGVNGKAEDGHSLEGQFGTIYRSPDGEHWQEVFRGGPVTESFNHAKNNLLRCATYGNGRFVVTGNPHAAFVSEDGAAWRVVEAPAGAFSVEFGNGLFVAPNAYGFMTSNDGLTWQLQRPQVDFPIWGEAGAGHVRKIVYGNGVFVCVGDQRLGVTKDGKTWLHHQILPPEKRPGRNLLLFGNGRFVWLCEKTGPQSSTDGIHWQPITTFGDLSPHAKFGGSGVFDGKRFLTSPSTYADKNKIIYGSKNGVDWDKVVEQAGGTEFTTAGNGILLRNMGWSQAFSLSKDGGKTWKQVKAGVPSRKVYFFDGQRIVGQSGG